MNARMEPCTFDSVSIPDHISLEIAKFGIKVVPNDMQNFPQSTSSVEFAGLRPESDG